MKKNVITISFEETEDRDLNRTVEVFISVELEDGTCEVHDGGTFYAPLEEVKSLWGKVELDVE